MRANACSKMSAGGLPHGTMPLPVGLGPCEDQTIHSLYVRDAHDALTCGLCMLCVVCLPGKHASQVNPLCARRLRACRRGARQAPRERQQSKMGLREKKGPRLPKQHMHEHAAARRG